MGRGDALADRIELEAVERTDEAAVAHRPSALGAQVGAHVGTDRLGHADASFIVAPGDDVLTQPGLRKQFVPEDGLAGCNEVPTLGEGIQCGPLVQYRTVCLHGARLPAVDACGGPLPEYRSMVGIDLPQVVTISPQPDAAQYFILSGAISSANRTRVGDIAAEPLRTMQAKARAVASESARR